MKSYVMQFQDFVFVHKSAVKRLVELLPLNEDNKRLYHKHQVLAEIQDLHKAGREWNGD